MSRTLGSFSALVLLLGLAACPGNDSGERGASGIPIARVVVEPPSLELGQVKLGESAVRTVTLSNPGTVVVQVEAVSVEGVAPGMDDATHVLLPAPPFALEPGTSRTVSVTVTPSSSGSLDGMLRIVPSEGAQSVVRLRGHSYVSPPGLTLGAPSWAGVVEGPHNAEGSITATSQSAVTVSAPVPAETPAAARLVVRAVDVAGRASTGATDATSGATAEVSLDTSDLADGPIRLFAHFETGPPGATLVGESQVGVAVKSTSTALLAPVLDPRPPGVTTRPVLTVTGTAPSGATVTAYGGTQPVARALDGEDEDFALHVPLRREARNTIWVCASMDGERTCTLFEIEHHAPRLMDVQVDVRGLDGDDAMAAVEALGLDAGVGHTLHESSICLQGDRDCVTFPVAGPSSGGGSCPDSIGAVCLAPRTGGGVPFVVRPFFVPRGASPPLVGALVIETGLVPVGHGVDVALIVAAGDGDLEALQVELAANGGLAVAVTAIGEPGGPTLSRSAQQSVRPTVRRTDGGGAVAVARFHVRGDAPGSHRLAVSVRGVHQSAGGAPVDLVGSLEHSLDVLGPPRLAIAVQAPPRVLPGHRLAVLFEITNPSPVPALHAWADLVLPAEATFYFPDTCEDPTTCCGAARLDHAAIHLGHLGPGQAVTHAAGLLGCADAPLLPCVQEAGSHPSLHLEAASSCAAGRAQAAPLAATGPVVQALEPASGARLPEGTDTLRAVLATPVARSAGPLLLTASVTDDDSHYSGELVHLRPDSLVALAGPDPSVAAIPDGTFSVERLHPVTGEVIGIVPGELSLGTVGGDVRLGRAVGGDIFLSTVGGDVRLGTSDDAFLSTVGGDVRLGTSDDVFLGTVGGEVRLGTVGGDVRLGTVGGDVRLGMVGGDVFTRLAEITFVAGVRDGVAIPPPAGSTQWLEPGSSYRVTLRGGPHGIMTRDPERGEVAPLAADVSWIIAIDPPGDATPPEPLNVTAVNPEDGEERVGLGSAVFVVFDQPLEPAGLRVARGSAYHETEVALVAGAEVAGGDLVGGTAIAVASVLVGGATQLILVPREPLSPGTTFHVRLANLPGTTAPPRDGVYLSRFTTDPFERPDDARDLVPDEILTDLQALGLPIHSGLNPPDIAASYHSDDTWTVYDEHLGGWLDEPLWVCEHTMTLLCVTPTECEQSISYAECAGGLTGEAVLVSGQGSCFTLYSRDRATFEGCSYDSVSVTSGCLLPSGDIEDRWTGGVGTDYQGAACDALVDARRMAAEGAYRMQHAEIVHRVASPR